MNRRWSATPASGRRHNPRSAPVPHTFENVGSGGSGSIGPVGSEDSAPV